MIQKAMIQGIRSTTLLGILVAASGCATPWSYDPGPSAPPTPGPTTAAGKGGAGTGAVSYTVTVNPVGPATWTYTMTGSFTAPFVVAFDTVQIHALGDISGCEVTAHPTPLTPFAVTRPSPNDISIGQSTNPGSWWTSIQFSLQCDNRNGSVHLFFIQGAPGGRPVGVVVGPIAGPQ